MMSTMRCQYNKARCSTKLLNDASDYRRIRLSTHQSNRLTVKLLIGEQHIIDDQTFVIRDSAIAALSGG
jgi:hypothetical protein